MTDEQHRAPDDIWTNPDVSPTQLVEYLFENLIAAESVEEYRKTCADLIRGARYLDADEIAALANAVEAGFPKRGRGQPARTKRARDIRYLLMFGRILPGRRDWKRVDLINEIMSKYRMNFKTAEAAYDKANRELKAEAAARTVRDLD
ncbi:hypothetical protein ACFFMP_20150 [Pseudoroseomonas cervicalis]|uniref:Uncharacterized protein n=1 Tax=Pseudoroseomonas cervicalis ATCC 49957 TaxID=525371 RepID=D5RQ68_9PROT|nr:hypothetical protein [Pseudoroseomonas cervicalis]EFH10526.1 hypothetical protein HMPREF0731_3230 [Pseudoroseomonas cervicalis ATCC 49957]